MSRRRELRIAIAVAVVSASIQAAQADDAAATAPTPLPKVTVTAEHESDGYLTDRSRTATKTDTPLLDVPQAVSVVTKDLIKDQSMQSIADVARYVPGAGMAQGEGNRDTIILRGNSSTSDFFLDGVRDDVEYFRDFYNIDRVEILKGPNAMIFGRGGAGGIVNRVTRQANWEPVRELSLQGGSWDNRRATVDFGDAVNDRVALRITGLYEDSDSYRDGFDFERMGVNPTAAFAIGEATVVRLSYEYYDYDRTADRGLPSELGRPFETDPSTFFGDPDRSITYATVNQGTVVIDHAFSDNVQLRNRTLYADYDKFYQNVYAGGPVDAGTGLVPISAYNNEQLRENFFNQTDLTFSFETGAIGHEFLVGRRARRAGDGQLPQHRLLQRHGPARSRVPASDPTVSVPVTFRQAATDADNHGRATIAAVYAQDQVQFSPKWLAVLGLRYDNFDMNFTNNRTAENFRTSDDLVSPRAGLIYKPVEDVSLYASYSMTYIPRAGAQLASLNVDERGARSGGVREHRARREVGRQPVARPDRGDLPARPQERRDRRIRTTRPCRCWSTASAREGIELGVSGQVSEAWSIQGGYAYQDGELTEQLGGTTLAQLPKNVVSLWNRYDFTPAWGVGLGVIYQTEMFAASDNLVTLPEFTRVDMRRCTTRRTSASACSSTSRTCSTSAITRTPTATTTSRRGRRWRSGPG